MSKYIVCPECRGEGYISKLGDFGPDQMDEWFGDDWDERDQFVRDYTRRGGPYDQPCPLCKGERVVTPEQEEAYQYEREAEAERRAEMTAAERWG